MGGPQNSEAGRALRRGGDKQQARKALHGWCSELAWRALELGERAALPAGTVLETAGTVSELAGMASEPAGNILEPAGNIVEPARSFLEPAGRGPQAS